MMGTVSFGCVVSKRAAGTYKKGTKNLLGPSSFNIWRVSLPQFYSEPYQSESFFSFFSAEEEIQTKQKTKNKKVKRRHKKRAHGQKKI